MPGLDKKGSTEPDSGLCFENSFFKKRKPEKRKKKRKKKEGERFNVMNKQICNPNLESRGDWVVKRRAGYLLCALSGRISNNSQQGVKKRGADDLSHRLFHS
jgi:hypothetical protein